MTGGGASFLGAWAVTEYVFAGDGTFQGTVAQERRLHRSSETGGITVLQTCTPAPELAGHPMAGFAGDFVFHLETQGHQRLYRGPDVLGSGTHFGDSFLTGRGMWPRFGYNFRSWSISLDPLRQLTGGVFFRGHDVAAVVVGIGVQISGDSVAAAPASPTPLPGPFVRASGHGQRASWCAATGRAGATAVTRQVQTDGGWREWGETFDEPYAASALASGCTTDGLITKGERCVGTTKAFGPLLSWELHDDQGAAVEGWDITDPDGSRQFSLRHNYQHGKLVGLHGLHFTI